MHTQHCTCDPATGQCSEHQTSWKLIWLTWFGWDEDEAPLNSFPTNVEPKPYEIFHGVFLVLQDDKMM